MRGDTECGLRPLRAVGSIYEPEAVGAAWAYPPACKPMAYKPTGWPPARSGTILRLGEKRPRREGGIFRFWILASGPEGPHVPTPRRDLGLWKRKRVRRWEDEKVGNVRLEFVSS